MTAITAAGFAAHGALAGPGDLDPSFGNVGRVFDFGAPTLWSLDVRDDGAVAFGGGEEYCGWYYACDEDAGFGRLLADGAPDATFAAATLAASVIYDTALQPDGKLVAVGRKTVDGQERLVVVRLEANGSLDAGFGSGGTFQMPDSGVASEVARAVLLEDDGRIVVLGSRGTGMVVVRLTPAGLLDETFGTGGIAKPATGLAFPTQLAHAAGAGYRLLANIASNPDVSTRPRCYVLGLTEAGAPDAAFGTAGMAPAPGVTWRSCSDFAVQADGAIVLGGPGGFLARMLPGGAPDPAFSGDALPDLLSTVSAVRLGSGGRIFVAGNAPDGLGAATVVRLLADGTIDTLFGHGGSTEFAIESDRPLSHSLHDMKVVAGNALVLGGGAYYTANGFVVRLLGDAAGSGPGIVSMGQYSTLATEQDGQATLHVRRVGGSAGAVTVTYAAQTGAGQNAVAGQDYTAVTGSLSWADGESGEREITVPILADTAAESQETFQVVLQSIEGGAAFGAKTSDIGIAGVTYPYGSFSFSSSGVVNEGAAAQVWVNRVEYCTGEVSVTVHLAGGSAQVGADFHAMDGSGWTDVTLTWADGECGSKDVAIETVADDDQEKLETVTFELTSPTGGAQVGAPAQASVSIKDPVRKDTGGGGALGSVGAALLGLLALLRRRGGRAPAA